MGRQRILNKLISKKQILSYTDKEYRELVLNTMEDMWFNLAHLIELTTEYSKDMIFNYIVKVKIDYNILCKYSKGYKRRFEQVVIDSRLSKISSMRSNQTYRMSILKMIHLIKDRKIEDLSEMYDLIIAKRQ